MSSLRVVARAVALVLLLSPTGFAALPEPSPAQALYLVALHGPVGEGTEAALRATGLEVVDRFPFISTVLTRGSAAAASAAAGLASVARVVPEEPLSLDLARSRAQVNAEDVASRSGESGANVTIAIVDSGVDASHPAFSGRVRAAVRIERTGLVAQGGEDSDGHGTHVAGILAGSGEGSRDGRLRGVAPGAGLVSVDISSSFTTTNAIRAFEYIHDRHASLGIRVVTNSWGREKADARYDPEDPVVRASNALVADGIVVVFSAGNLGEDGRGSLTVEAQNPNVISVGAVGRDGRVEPYSSRGPARDADGNELPWIKPDLVAPGTGILSARTSAKAPSGARDVEERLYTVMNGTSMAAPHAGAAAALLLSLDPSLSPAVVAGLLRATARDVGPAGADPAYGHGLLDVDAALAALRQGSGRTDTVRVVTREPFRAAGDATTAPEAVVLQSGAPRVPPTDAVEVPLRLRPGTERLLLWFNWTDPRVTFSLRLDGDGGRLGPFLPAGGASIRVETPITPGSWTLRATPSGAAVLVDYSIEGDVEVVETRVLERTSGLPGGSLGLVGTGGGFAPFSTVGPWAAAAPSWAWSAVQLLCLGAFGGAVMLRLRRRA